jgi:hypothetical protein
MSKPSLCEIPKPQKIVFLAIHVGVPEAYRLIVCHNAQVSQNWAVRAWNPGTGLFIGPKITEYLKSE